MKNVDLNRYKDFVEKVTSTESNDLNALILRLQELDKHANIALLLTAGIGLASEGGEFDEIVKKCVFQGKPLDEATQFHLMRELGDIAWYWVSACRALGVDPNSVILENVKKLESRYPGGTFDVSRSENRSVNDI